MRMTGNRQVKFYRQGRYVTFLRGWFAWELQIGPVVIQVVHKEHVNGPSAQGRKVLVWRDRYWSRLPKIVGR